MIDPCSFAAFAFVHAKGAAGSTLRILCSSRGTALQCLQLISGSLRGPAGSLSRDILLPKAGAR